MLQVYDATAVSEHGFEDDATAVSEENAPSGQHRRSNRHLRTTPERLVIGEEVIRWKEAHAATDRHWLRTYTMQHFHVSDTERLQRLSNYACKCGIAFTRSLTEEGKETGWIGRGNREDGHRCQRVPWKKRVRAPGAGRPEKCPELSAELFQYWVDRAETIKARVPSPDLCAHAAVLLSVMKEAYDLAVAEGREPGGRDLPEYIGYVWLHRWRNQWGLTWRTVTLVYKVSWVKARHRHGVLWVNIIYMRCVHEELVGPGLLRFVAVDEKPFWFNALYRTLVLARRGQRDVQIREAAGKRHERCSGMSVCASWDWVNDERPMLD